MTTGDSDQTDAAEETARVGEHPQFAIPLGAIFGLLIAAVLCLGYAWWHRDPELPLATDHSSITSMLWRTTIVVAVCAAVVVGCFVAVGLYRQAYGLRAKFLAYVSPALVIAAISGVVALYRGQTYAAFKGAVAAQEALDPFDVVAVARWAWWCACLAVVALAVLAVFSYALYPTEQLLYVSRGLAAATGAVVVVVIAASVFATGASSVPHHTASRIDAPVLTAVTGEVGYRIEPSESAPLPAGAGFVRLVKTDRGHYSYVFSIEGYDGATGKRRWVYGPTKYLSILGSTGVGPESVVLARAANILIGIDATTGELLWFKQGATSWDDKQMLSSLSPTAIVAVREDAESADGEGLHTVWEAIAPRTGEVLWTKEFHEHDPPGPFVTDDAVVVAGGADAPDDVIDVIDAKTGEKRRSIPLALFGVNPADVQRDVGSISLTDVRGDLALITLDRYGPPRVATTFVVNVNSGTVEYQVPAGAGEASFLSEGLLLLSQSRGSDRPTALSMLNLSMGATTPIGFGDLASSHDGANLVAQVGNAWWTLLPQDGEAKGAVERTLRSIGDVGAASSFPNPCQGLGAYGSGIVPVPGALLVRCSGGVWVGVK